MNGIPIRTMNFERLTFYRKTKAIETPEHRKASIVACIKRRHSYWDNHAIGCCRIGKHRFKLITQYQSLHDLQIALRIGEFRISS